MKERRSPASRTGNVEAMKVLLDHGADVNAKETLRGTTALMWAADEAHPPAVQLLIQRGADIEARSNIPQKRRWTGLSPSEGAIQPIVSPSPQWSIVARTLSACASCATP